MFVQLPSTPVGMGYIGSVGSDNATPPDLHPSSRDGYAQLDSVESRAAPAETTFADQLQAQLFW